mmetsp:Transcript_91956/g.268918  ORF Transcript_91956/g.268918 Transcript_91956/m.268918 type:complete len:348 (+) Transcript_91956:1419-2462(+)
MSQSRIIAEAISSFMRQPPDSSWTDFSCISAGKPTCSSAAWRASSENLSPCLPSWWQNCTAVRSLAATSTSGRTCSVRTDFGICEMPPLAMVLMRVVLPTPLRPTTPYRWPFRSSSTVSFSRTLPPPYMSMRLSTLTSASAAALPSCWPPVPVAIGASSMPSKTCSRRPDRVQLVRSWATSPCFASGLSSTSSDDFAAVKPLASRQHERTTASTYLLSGLGMEVSRKSFLARFPITSLRAMGAGGTASASTAAAAAAAASLGSLAPKPRGSAVSSSDTSPSSPVFSSAKQLSAAETRAGWPEAFRPFSTLKSVGMISAFAFCCDCTRSFHSSVAFLLTPGFSSVLAM